MDNKFITYVPMYVPNTMVLQISSRDKFGPGNTAVSHRLGRTDTRTDT